VVGRRCHCLQAAVVREKSEGGLKVKARGEGWDGRQGGGGQQGKMAEENEGH